MENLVIVAEDGIAEGFRLAGVMEVYKDPNKVNESLNRKDVAILVLTRPIFDFLDEATKERIKGTSKPSVVILDDSEASMKSLVKLATGIEVKE